MNGFFVTFEGVEGCGKSTQLDRLLGELTSRRITAVAVREPGGTQLGREVRSILLDPSNAQMVPEAELLLYAASRAQLVRQVIQPALAHGHVVLSDRFADSTVAYQCHGRGLDRAAADSVNAIATGGLVPDVTFLLDVPAEVGLSRVRGELDRIERESMDFHERVRDGFLAIARAEPERVVVLDGTAERGELAAVVASRVIDSLAI